MYTLNLPVGLSTGLLLYSPVGLSLGLRITTLFTLGLSLGLLLYLPVEF